MEAIGPRSHATVLKVTEPEPPRPLSDVGAKKATSSVIDVRSSLSLSPASCSNDNSSHGGGGSATPATTDTSATFGSRLLTPKQDVFEYNAWDHVDPGSDHERYAEEMIRQQREFPAPAEEKDAYNARPNEFWDQFYQSNQNKFFKDRKWLKLEFPELFNWTSSPRFSSASRVRVMELGCGAGNIVFPLLQEMPDRRLMVHACDFSKTAVEVVKGTREKLQPEDQARCDAFIWDISSDRLPEGVAEGSVDFIVMVFVFSALHPSQWRQTIDNLYKASLLKPGGMVFFRDYGRYDLAQVRFKKHRLLEDNLYARGDGTRVYFFTSEQIHAFFGERFVVEQNAVDRRLIVNRKRKVKMYRVWLQGKFRKPDWLDP
ncbi:hypothetical protein EV182_000486 [Spiromyces aspiralis]|uniref:Uncharacterized protein n=1 Tax=Spiromyces aspiralis TaxID=68401 RepID=A0ACC1HHJ7_9FUNG|nr:hypothetical protein EV182_000486 [Spiromyces aspiralis]